MCKMAERTEDITNIVRRVVSSLGNLSSNGRNENREENRSNSATNNEESNESSTFEDELSRRFNLPRVQASSTVRPLPRSGSGRFVPYSTKAKKAKEKAKDIRATAELVIKDVCLLPNPEWDRVPRRQTEEDLVKQNLFIDAWTLDKTWTESQLRKEISKLYPSRNIEPNDFEFVKAVGNTISKVQLPKDQEINGRIVKHVSGTGPLYIRALKRIDDDSDEDDPGLETDAEDPIGNDIRSYCFGSASTSNNRSSQISSQASNVIGESSVDVACSSTTYDARNRSFAVSRNSAERSNRWHLSDIECEQLREMFPTCSENIIKQAIESSVTLDDAVDSLMDLKTQEDPGVQGDNCGLAEVLVSLRPSEGRAPKRLTVRRDAILSDSISYFKQRDFDFKTPLKITFEGEPAIDGGGPTREFFTILTRELLSSSSSIRLFEGNGRYFLPIHNTDALRSNLFKVAGRMVTASICHGGPGFPVFSNAVYSYFKNPNPDDLSEYVKQEDVVDVEVIEALNTLDELDEDDVKRFAGELQALLTEAGFPHVLTFENRLQAMTALCLHSVFLTRKAELDQFRTGLGPIVDIICKHPNNAKPLLQAGHNKPLTANEILPLVKFDDIDEKHKEFFQEYLRTESSKLPGLLMFATGCRQIPPMGYCTPSFITVTQNTSVFPNANTCPLELEVPGLVNTFDEFKRSIDSAINYQEEGFGII